MMMKKILAVPALSMALLVTGCATTSTGPRTSQSDVDALNAKLSSLQADLSEKQAELAKLENRMKAESQARAAAESETKTLSRKLDSALSDLESARKVAAAPKPAPRPDSDLK